jgi:amidophosphoribosyltransferase
MSGIFGVASKESCIEDLVYGTDYHTHMGTEYAGLAVYGKEFSRYIHRLSSAYFKTRFMEDIRRIEGAKGIGVISDLDEQPVYIKSKLGPFCIVTNGKIDNIDELTNQMMSEGVSFSEFSKNASNMAELAGKIIAQSPTVKDGIETVHKVVSGACSLLVLTPEGIFASRDACGRTTLVLAKSQKGWAVCSESGSLLNLGYQPVRDLDPGETVFITEKGVELIKKGSGKKKVCAFLWMYTGFPASSYEGINSEVVREASGKKLAARDKDLKADMVAGVPDSGMAHAIGYAMESKLPLRRPLVKYTPTYGRSYSGTTQTIRDLTARMKLIAIQEIISGNSIVLLEDSIVRGTQLKKFTVDKFWNAGARELHVRPASPPLMFPCIYTSSTRTTSELITRKAIKEIEGKDIEDISEYLDHTTEKYAQMIEWLRKYLNVTSLKYQTLDDMVEAIGLPKENLCLHCWEGKTCVKNCKQRRKEC